MRAWDSGAWAASADEMQEQTASGGAAGGRINVVSGSAGRRARSWWKRGSRGARGGSDAARAGSRGSLGGRGGDGGGTRGEGGMQDSLHSWPGPTRGLGPERVARRVRALEQTVRERLAAARPQRNLTRKAKLGACLSRKGSGSVGSAVAPLPPREPWASLPAPASTSILADAFIDIRILSPGLPAAGIGSRCRDSARPRLSLVSSHTMSDLGCSIGKYHHNDTSRLSLLRRFTGRPGGPRRRALKPTRIRMTECHRDGDSETRVVGLRTGKKLATAFLSDRLPG
jgi:hypothetical protein